MEREDATVRISLFDVSRETAKEIVTYLHSIDVEATKIETEVNFY